MSVDSRNGFGFALLRMRTSRQCGDFGYVFHLEHQTFSMRVIHQIEGKRRRNVLYEENNF